MFKIVVIKGKRYKLVKEDSVWKYLTERCGCPCKERLPYKKRHLGDGIPYYINGHNRITNESLERRNAILSEPTIIIGGIKVYERYRCHCEDENGINCGLHIPFPITESRLKNHIRKSIPNVIKGHVTEETRQKLIEAQLEYYKEHPERAEKQSEIMTGKNIGEDNGNYNGGKEASHRRSTKKHRELGFKPFNFRFEDSHEHHIDNEFVIHIPDELHKFYWHRQNNTKLMKIINDIAFDFLGMQGELKYNRGIKNDDDVTTLAINYVNMKYRM